MLFICMLISELVSKCTSLGSKKLQVAPLLREKSKMRMFCEEGVILLSVGILYMKGTEVVRLN